MASKILVGRKEEQAILKEALSSDESELIAVIGRRRVGKTYLVNQVYGKKIVFEITGLQNAPKKEQIANFVLQLKEVSGSTFPIKTPQNWLEAFALLITYLKTKTNRHKQVVFFDELPWLATHKSGFLRGFSYFWNSWAVKQDIVVVICGSAASWMIQKVVNNKGGLYNRVTKRIYLEPFTLAETEAYLLAKRIRFNRYQIIQLYMAMGGIPHYLKEIKKGRSAVQNINAICFGKSGLLKSEFLRLYPSLFANADYHLAVIRALASIRQGLTRNEIIKMAKIPSGGTPSRVLEELLYSGFISSYRPFGKKKKEKLYRLTDEYSLFFIDFIENIELEGDDYWKHLSQTQTFKSWSGYTFENICLKHLPQIKKALGISGVFSTSSSFYKKGTKYQKGVQIDLLIDRNDQVINLIEIKFYKDPIIISKELAYRLREKTAIFKHLTNSSKQIFVNLISPFGLLPNEHSGDLIDQVLTLDDLFVEV